MYHLEPAHERLILTGYMGAGKSTIGRLLADRLNYRFYDTDRQIVLRFHKSISKIFAQEGEAVFRQSEVEVLDELIGMKNVVISTGGGTLAREETFAKAHENGTVIYLEAPIEALFERAIFSRKDRPILNEPNTEDVFRERFEQRLHFYERSHLTINTYEKKTSAIVDEILQALGLPAQPIADGDIQP